MHALQRTNVTSLTIIPMTVHNDLKIKRKEVVVAIWATISSTTAQYVEYRKAKEKKRLEKPAFTNIHSRIE